MEHPPRCGGVPGWSSSSGEDRLGGTDRGPGRRARGRASNGATSDHESGIGCSAAVPAILTILRGDGRDGNDFSMRTKAASALAEIGPEAHEAAYFLWECIQEPGDDALTAGLRLRAAFSWMIQQEPDYLLEIGIKAMTSPSSGLRCQAAALLGHLGAAGQPALPHLGERWRIRIGSFRSGQRVRSRRLRPLLDGGSE